MHWVNFFGKADKYGIDAVVNGLGRSVYHASRQVRGCYSGQVGSYVLLMVIGMILLFVIQVFLKNN